MIIEDGTYLQQLKKDVSSMLKDTTNHSLSQDQVKGIVVAYSLAGGMGFASRMALRVRVGVSAQVLRLAKHANRHIRRGTCIQSQYLQLRRTDKKAAKDILLFAMAASYGSNPKYFQKLREFLEHTGFENQTSDLVILLSLLQPLGEIPLLQRERAQQLSAA